eukprot:3093976-Prymnesium_polylepis.1
MSQPMIFGQRCREATQWGFLARPQEDGERLTPQPGTPPLPAQPNGDTGCSGLRSAGHLGVAAVSTPSAQEHASTTLARQHDGTAPAVVRDLVGA